MPLHAQTRGAHPGVSSLYGAWGKAGVPAGRLHPVQQERHHRAGDRTEDSGSLDPTFVEVHIEEDVAQEPADEAADEDCR